jgi:two-component system, cell cycle sensor histidine kinase and response regulator CckA
MTEIPAPKTPRPSLSWLSGFSTRWQIGLAVLAIVVVIATAIAVLAPDQSGIEGTILLVGVAVLGFVLLLAVIAGDKASTMLTPAGMANAERERDHLLGAAGFEVAPEPGLIMDRSGSPIVANSAYRNLARHAGALGESGRPAGFERVFGGHPSVSAAIFRMSRAAKKGEPWAEPLPPIVIGPALEPVAYDIAVLPLGEGRSLWRATPRQMGREDLSALSDPMLEEAPVGFFSTKADGKVVYANAALRAWTGLQSVDGPIQLKDMLGDDAALILARGRQGGGVPVRTEVTLIGRDGIRTPATVITAWPQSEGAVTSRSVVFGQSNTGAPPALGSGARLGTMNAAAAGALLDNIFANAPFGIARLDSSDFQTAVLEDANPSLLDITAGKAGPGTRFANLFDLSDEAVRKRFAECDASASEPLELVLAGHEKGGEVQVWFAPDRAGRVAAFIIDASRQKEIERQLFQSQKLQAIGQLAGGIAHDMNNFLQVIRSNTELLIATHPVGDPDFPLLNNMLQATYGGAGLIKQLLAFSRKQTVRPQILDLAANVSELGVMLRQLLGDSVRLETRHGRDLPFIRMDKTQLETIIMNLATNARDAMRPQGGVLTVRTGRATHDQLTQRHLDEVVEGDYGVIEVVDTGHGMDEATMSKIFEPFFTTKEAGQGTGLGLATVFGIVRQAGGHVLVDSQVGAGTTFRLFIPAYAPREEELEAIREAERVAIEKASKPSDLAGSGRILLVEDNDGVRQGAAMALQRAGYEVIQAADGEEALEWLEENPQSIDLMVSDVMMPGMDGPTLLREARELLGTARVIFMSGFAEDDFSETLTREREVSFLPKPFAVPDLARKVKEMMQA